MDAPLSTRPHLAQAKRGFSHLIGLVHRRTGRKTGLLRSSEAQVDEGHAQSAFGIRADLIAGPATDNRVGERFVASLGLPARNARADAEALGKFVLDLVEPKIAAKV